MQENTQKFVVPFTGLVRVLARRENSIRYNVINSKNGELAVLNFSVMKRISDGDDDTAPVIIDLALWGKMAERYNGVIEDGQICFVDSRIEFEDNSYEKEGEAFPRFKGSMSINNGYQFTLFDSDGVIKGNVGDYQQQSETPSAKPSAKSVVDNDDVPF